MKINALVLKNLITQFDSFGVNFHTQIQKNNEKFKSFIGGIVSIFIYVSAAAFFAYLIQQWSSNKFLPKIASRSIYKSNGSSFELNFSPFLHNVLTYDSNLIDKLKGKKVYDVMAERESKDNYEVDNSLYKKQKIQQSSSYIYTLFENLELNADNKKKIILSQNSQNISQDTYLGFQFLPCNSTDLDCVSLENLSEIQDFINCYQILIFHRQDYNIETDQIELIPQNLYFPLSNKTKMILQLQLIVTRLTISKGFFFPSYEPISFISKIEINPVFSDRIKSDDSYLEIWLSLGRTEEEVRVEYPRLPEILAQFSSVYSVLILFGVIIQRFNQQKMLQFLANQIGEIYFEDYNKIYKENEIEQILPISFAEFLKKRKQFEKKLIQKANILNILHDISKIQISLLMIMEKERLKLAQSTKFKLVDEIEKSQMMNQINELNFSEFLIFNCNSQILDKPINQVEENKSLNKELKSLNFRN